MHNIICVCVCVKIGIHCVMSLSKDINFLHVLASLKSTIRQNLKYLHLSLSIHKKMFTFLFPNTHLFPTFPSENKYQFTLILYSSSFILDNSTLTNELACNTYLVNMQKKSCMSTHIIWWSVELMFLNMA